MEYNINLPDGQTFGPADLETIKEWTRQKRVPRDAMLVPADGGDPKPVTWQPELAALFNAPPIERPAEGSIPTNDVNEGMSTIVPYKNPPALTAYYLSVFSLIPFIGLLLSIPAVILGIIGLKKYRANPKCKGAAHAWVGIILGGLMTLLWGGIIAFAILAINT